MSDAYNESPNGNSSSDHNLIDTELQVRLMNLVMGEASDFERDQLQLLMEQRPELAAYCKHLEHLHGLLNEVGAGEPTIDVDSTTDDAGWRLPADRRERVLAVLENRSANPPPKVTLANQSSFRSWRITTMEAIVVASIACVILGLMLPATQSAREAAKSIYFYGGTDLTYRTSDMVPLTAPANRPPVGRSLNTILSASDTAAPSAVTTDLFSHPGSFARNEVTSELAVLKDNTDSMSITNGSSVRGQTLPSYDYLSDDIQYSPASPENKMASAPPVSGTVDGMAVKKGREAYGETQLGESKFGLAADGEKAMARRSATAGKPSEVVSPSVPGSKPAGAPSPSNSIATDKRYIQPSVPSPNFSDIVSLDQVNDSATPPSVVVGLSSGVAGAAAPALTTDLDFQIRNNFGVTPAFGAPDMGAVVRPMASTPPSVWYKDFQTKTETTENKFALEPSKAIPMDDLTESEGRQADGEQRLTERNFGGLAENGEKNMGGRGATAAGVADDGVDGRTRSFGLGFDSSVENMPMSGEWAKKPGSAEHWAIEKSDSKKLWDRAADPKDQNSYWNDTQKTDRYTLEFESPKSDVATWELGTAEAKRKPVEATDSEASFSVAESESMNRSITIQGASIPGLRNKTSTPNVGENKFSELQATEGYDVPAILGEVQVDQTKPKGQVVMKGRESDVERVNELIKLQIQQMEPTPDQKVSSLRARNTDATQPGHPLANRLNPNGTKELAIKEVQPGVPITIYVPDTPGEIKNDETRRNRKLETAPSPELAKNGRDGTNAGGKPSTPKQPVTLDEQSAASEAFSTFSLHVSDVSFKLAQAALSQSQWPEAAKIRIEEFVNALDYHDPLPSGDQKIACRVEQAVHPFLMQRNLLRVSMRTAAAGRSQNTPLRLTLLLDNSGSMERPDRRQAVLRAFQTLSQQLKATDQITLISFASSPRLLADKVPGNQGETLLKLIETLPSEGGTDIESALKLAREKAAEQQVAGAQNRIVLLTDGAVNLGDANPENLARQVTQMRDAGIAFDAAGISAQDLNDEVLEALTRQGDGRYYLLDSAEAASESFAAQIAGSLRPSAQNVKVQVEFNPQRVGRYKLLGYEKHRLNKEDFRNDQVDAAEMAAAEAGVAVYQFEIKPKGSGDVGSVSVRFRDLSTGQMVERRWPILYESNTPRLEQSQPSMQLAAAAALFAAKLGGGPLADSVDMAQLQKIFAKLPEQFASQPRVKQLRTMIEQAIAIH